MYEYLEQKKIPQFDGLNTYYVVRLEDAKKALDILCDHFHYRSKESLDKTRVDIAAQVANSIVTMEVQKSSFVYLAPEGIASKATQIADALVEKLIKSK